MTLPSAIQLATLIVVVAGAASKELELSRGFWGWFPPIVARWLPTAVAVLGALPSLFSGVTNWDGFSMGLLAAIGVGLKHAHDPLPPPAESDGVDSTPRTVRTGGSAGGGMAFKAREKLDERIFRQRERSFRPVRGFASIAAFRSAFVVAFLFAMFFAFLLACVSCSPSSSSAPGGNATPLEAAVIVQAREVQTDAEGVDTAVYLADCNGVAVGQKSILTATHCMTDRQHAIGDTVYFVDADTWAHTTQGHSTARFVAAAGDLATLEADAPLSAWVSARASAVDGPATLVHLEGTDIVETPVVLTGTNVDGMRHRGDSGSSLSQGDALVGIMSQCLADASAPNECLPGTGSFVAAVVP